ncbi:zinc dependent phospholipase C family protein [Paenibacillus sp. NPDC056579]|uniref:zinc dependent phospholipase C family protein n=1 Tax=Paenibacillus sp. NPDC056579 TaxID=3345871 RepID=UPI003699A4A0
MIHLQVAVSMFDEKDVPAPFLLGSIAPDAIHMRKHTTREDKKFTHLDIEAQGESLDYSRQEYHRLLHLSDDESWRWFVRGYFAHLMTDYYWLHQVYRPFKERAMEEGLDPDSIRKAYYTDTDQIDFDYYRTKPWKNRVWEQLIQTPSYNPEPYLSADEIHCWRLRIVHWFDLIATEPGVAPLYITEPIVDAFCKDTVQQIIRVLQTWDSKFPIGQETLK